MLKLIEKRKDQLRRKKSKSGKTKPSAKKSKKKPNIKKVSVIIINETFYRRNYFMKMRMCLMMKSLKAEGL